MPWIISDEMFSIRRVLPFSLLNLLLLAGCSSGPSERIASDEPEALRIIDYLGEGDEWLAATGGLVDKGRVPTQLGLGSSGFPDCSVATCGDVAPVQYALGAADPDNMFFRRPDTTKTYFLVVDDSAPDYFTITPPGQGAAGGIVGRAAALIENASASDCLGSTLFTVLRNSEFQALPLATRQANYATQIRTGDFFEVCSGSAVGCANLPRVTSVQVNGVSTQRLRFGDRINFVDTGLVEPTTALVELSAYTIGVAAHELLHTLGFGHTVLGVLEERAVPGTEENPAHPSIMQASSDDTNHRDTPQPDDILQLNQLYAGSCGFDDGFRLITP
jgi:hypothetical protein